MGSLSIKKNKEGSSHFSKVIDAGWSNFQLRMSSQASGKSSMGFTSTCQGTDKSLSSESQPYPLLFYHPPPPSAKQILGPIILPKTY